MGSGSTGKAAIRGGFDFIGIEREKEYFEISKTRIEYEKNRPVSKPIKGNRVEVKPEVKEKINQFLGNQGSPKAILGGIGSADFDIKTIRYSTIITEQQ
jgi:hypothetical protein